MARERRRRAARVRDMAVAAAAAQGKEGWRAMERFADALERDD